MENNKSDYFEDENFINWVKDPNPDSNQYWTKYQQDFPESIPDIQLAKLVVKMLSPLNLPKNSSTKEEVIRKIITKISGSASGDI